MYGAKCRITMLLQWYATRYVCYIMREYETPTTRPAVVQSTLPHRHRHRRPSSVFVYVCTSARVPIVHIVPSLPTPRLGIEARTRGWRSRIQSAKQPTNRPFLHSHTLSFSVHTSAALSRKLVRHIHTQSYSIAYTYVYIVYMCVDVCVCVCINCASTMSMSPR